NMKALLVASVLSSVLASAAVAATVTVPDNSTTLAGVAAAATALLLDAGLKPRNAGGGVLAGEAKNFHCDQLLNTATHALSMHAGLPTVKCRTNSPNKRGASAGPLFNDGRAAAEGAGSGRRRVQRLRHGLLWHLRQVDQMHHRYQDRQL